MRASERRPEEDGVGLAALAERGQGAVRAGGPAAGAVLRLQRAAGNRATTRTLQRYKILGPWNKGQAVHETLTVLAVDKAIQSLKDAGIDPGVLLSAFKRDKIPQESAKFGFDPEYADRSFMQFIRGVVWADDPKGLLFDKDEDTTDYSSGYMWYSEFSSGEKGKFAADKSDLIARSHFGDLQFFHGMASRDNESPFDTKDKMLNWAGFLIDVASGRLSPNTKISAIPAIKDLFPANANWTVKQLFVYANASDVQARQRAVGTLFHLIQDSFAHGHVQRDPATDDIEEFHAYGSQDEDEHAGFDELGPGKTLGQQLDATVGARSAIKRCAEVLVMIARGDSTGAIVDHLDKVVFKLSPKLFMAGPGKGLGKKGTTPADTPVPSGVKGDFPLPAPGGGSYG
jgi:hypothetical protein